MFQLPMELRGVDGEGRTIDGVCVPYDEISYLTPNPAGERVLRGAFAKSVQQQASKVFLFRGHDHAHPVGRAVRFEDRPDGLYGSFSVRRSVLGDEVLADVREGYLPAMSVGFKPVQARRGRDGETEVVEAQLKEVSLLPLGAYEGAKVLALREADVMRTPTAPFDDIDLSPTLPGWLY
jgi:HK97 family phage prohead protease